MGGERKILVNSIYFIRALALYSTYDGSQQGFFSYVGGNKNKNKISWLANVGGKTENCLF